jgi:peptide/nickel transport system substrate-binding protein
MTTLLSARKPQMAVTVLLIILTTFLAACGDSTPTAATNTQATSTTAAAGATTAAGGAATTAAQAGPASSLHLVANCGQAATFTRNFNPFTTTARFPTFNGVYEPLIVYNSAKGEFVPWLADKYEWSADNKTLTFTMHDGVKWSDGQPFTAKDVVFTFNLFKNTPGLSGLGSPAMTGDSAYIDSVTAPDDKTAVFKFKQVFTPGFYDIIYQDIVPEHIWKDVADPVKFTNDNPVGTGPFTEVKNFQAQSYQVDKNPNYWQPGKPTFAGISCSASASNDQINLRLADGTVDWSDGGYPNVDSAYVATDPDHRGYWFATTGPVVTLDLNTTMKPFDDVNVRKAMSMALNRDQITKVAVFGYVKGGDVTGLADGYPNFKVSDPNKLGDWTNYNVDKANQMLDAAGLKKGSNGTRQMPDGKPMSFKLNVASGFAVHVSAAQIIAQNLKAVGIDVTLAPVDAAGWLANLQKGSYEMSMDYPGSNNLYATYRLMMSKITTAPIGQVALGGNYTRYVSTKGDDLLSQFAATSDPAKQKQIAEQLQQVFADEAPLIPVYLSPLWYLYNSTRFVGWPTKDNAYAVGTYGGSLYPEQLIVMTTIKPR